MKARQVKSIEHIQYKGKDYTIMVYGEIKDVKEINGFNVVPVKYNGKTGAFTKLDYENMITIPSIGTFYSKTKEFNMGWAICVEPDTFNEEQGVKICKRRFSKSPITSQNGRFLTPDMCQAIVDNEVKYIIKNIDFYLPKNQGTDDNKIEEVKQNKNKEITVSNGDFISFYKKCDKRLQVGIVKETIDNTLTFHFCAPVDDNGLIVHDESKLYNGTIKKDEYYVCSMNDAKVKKLIVEYLKGAMRRMWDEKGKIFRLIVD